MKQKTGKKLLSVLLALAMVIGLVPGMSLPAYADDDYTVTVYANNGTDESYSFSVEDFQKDYDTEDLGDNVIFLLFPDLYGFTMPDQKNSPVAGIIAPVFSK